MPLITRPFVSSIRQKISHRLLFISGDSGGPQTPALPYLSISGAAAVQTEGDSGATAFTFTVARTGDLSATSSVNWAVSGSGANPAAASDFVGGVFPSGTLNFAIGQGSATITVQVSGDTTVEQDETFQVALSSPVGAVLVMSVTTGRIDNDDVPPPPVLALGSGPTLAEGNSGSTNFVFTVTRTGDLAVASSASWAVSGTGDHPAAASDFVGGAFPSGTVSFAVGQDSATITVAVAGDTAVEDDEAFLVTLSAPVNATISTAQNSATITNDDTVPLPTLAIGGGPTLSEGDSGATVFTFPVTRSGDLTGTSSATWTVSGNGANPAASSDFVGGTFPTGTVSFTAGQSEATISVSVAGDTLVETDEGFRVTLSAPVGATITTAQGSATILNDDSTPPPAVAYDPAWSRQTGDAGSADFVSGIDSGWATVSGTAVPSFNGWSVVDERLRVELLPTQSMDPGTGNNIAGLAAPRIESAITNGDFDVEVQISSDAQRSQATYAGHGFILRTATSSARIETYVQVNNLTQQGYIKFGTSTTGFTAPTPPTMSNGTAKGYHARQRLRRVGDVFTFFVAPDGINWVQCAQFTWAVTLTHLGLHFYHLTPNGGTTVFSVDHIHFGDPKHPVIASELNYIPLLNEPFNDLANWRDDSAGGGTASIVGGALSLACQNADGSTGRIVSTVDYPENVGLKFRLRRTSASASAIYFGAVVRGQSLDGADWAGVYAPPLALVYEGNHATSTVRLLRTGGPHPTAPDGAKWTYFYEENVPAANLGGWVWVHLQAIGPYFRYRVWADGSAEPSTWQKTVLDDVIRGPGKVGFAVSHNNGVPSSGSIEFDDVSIYEVKGPVAVAADTTPPVFSNVTYSAQTKTVDFDVQEDSGSVNLVWATCDVGAAVSYTLGGGWTGPVYETGAQTVPQGSTSFDAEITATTPDGNRDFVFYGSDAVGNLSTRQVVGITVSNAAAPDITFELATAGGVVVPTGTPDVTISSNMQAGDLLVAIVAERSGVGSSNTDVTDSNGKTWTKLGHYDNLISDSNGRFSIAVHYRIVEETGEGDLTPIVTGEPNTLNPNGTPGGMQVLLIRPSQPFAFTPSGFSFNGSGLSDWNNLSTGTAVSTAPALEIAIAAARNGSTLPTTPTFASHNDAHDTRTGGSNQISFHSGIKTALQPAGSISATLTSNGVGNEGIAGLLTFIAG